MCRAHLFYSKDSASNHFLALCLVLGMAAFLMTSSNADSKSHFFMKLSIFFTSKLFSFKAFVSIFRDMDCASMLCFPCLVRSKKKVAATGQCFLSGCYSSE